MQRNKNADYTRIQILGLVLLLPKLLEVLKSCFFLSSSALTIGVYVVVLAISILQCPTIKFSNIALLIFVYGIFAFNYFVFENTRKYMLGQEMLLIYFFFIPIGVFVFKEIHSWDNFVKILYPFSVVSIFLNTLVFAIGNRDLLSYMEVSYSLLPFLAILYYNIRMATAHRIISIVFWGVGIVEMLAFGARGPMLFLAVFILLYETLRTDIAIYKKVLLSVGIITLIFILYFFNKSIIDSLSNKKFFENSYILQHLANGGFFQHKTRTVISQQCLRRIESMGMEVSGLFGDRYYCGGIYPHNIIYELLMSLGWVLGGLILLLLLVLMLRSFLKEKNRTPAIFLIATLFLRFFVSGSYLIEGKFWIFLFALISLQNKTKKATINGKL